MIKILLILIQLIFILRFHIELSKMNGFMEPVNTFRQLTNPLVLLIKKIIPWYQVKKVAAIIVAFLLGLLIVILFDMSIAFATNTHTDSVVKQVSNPVLVELFFLIDTWIMFLRYGVFLFAIGSWIKSPAFVKSNYLLGQLFEPMLRPIQRIIPAVAGFDFSPIIFFFALSFIEDAVTRLFMAL